jgi:hypothetical protein
MDEIQYVGNRKDLPEGFAMIIPKGPYVPPKEPWFKAYREYGYWHMRFKIPPYPKWLDRALKPLCKYGWHRWIGTFGFMQYSYPAWPPYPDKKTTSREVKQEHHFRCARCGKNKSVPITTNNKG